VYREAIRGRVCAVCLDGTDDARCALASRERCPLDELLEHLVDAIRDVELRRDDAFAAAAVEARVCGHCTERDASGLCRSRRDGRCAVAVYLPLLVEAVLEVDARPDSA
jgi:hypothetical protein